MRSRTGCSARHQVAVVARRSAVIGRDASPRRAVSGARRRVGGGTCRGAGRPAAAGDKTNAGVGVDDDARPDVESVALADDETTGLLSVIPAERRLQSRALRRQDD